MSREYIAATLKRLREKSGLTADEVGEKIGKSGKTVNAWENGRGQPDADILIELCDIYEVDNILDEFREKEKASAPKRPEAEAIEMMMDYLHKGLVAGGFVAEGQDIDSRSTSVLISVIRALFDD